MTHGTKEFLKYSVLQGKEVNEVGFLKEFLIGEIVSQIYLREIRKVRINVSSNACDVDGLVPIPGRVFHEMSL